MTSRTHRTHEKSEALRRRAEARIPGGVNSNIRLATRKLFFTHGEGAWLWDADGHDYVDYLLGQGPNILGHASPVVQAAVAEACRKGMVYGAQHPLEVDAADLVCEVLGWPDMVRFGVSGTESVQAAVRLARAATGRRKFIRFQGHYHGWLDNVLIDVVDGKPRPASQGQVASYLDDCVLLPWNDADAVRRVLEERGGEIAAILTEPVMLNSCSIEPEPGYLEALRRMCDEHGVVLIFDEVITGFRVALGGAVERFGVAPDLAVYGKAVGAGWPVSLLAGRGDLMERIGTGEVNHSGTLNGSVMATAAALASIQNLRRTNPYAQMENHGRAVMQALEQAGQRHGFDLHVQGLPMAFNASFGGEGRIRDFQGLSTVDSARYRRLVHLLSECGVWVAGRGIWFVSAAHADKELKTTIERVDAAFEMLAAE